ncbi:MAG: nucleotidyltransferase domain-containing protein [Anaerolineae bacterium]|jgi:predicted nucleotidyltransferase
MAAEGGAAHLALARELARRFGALAEVRAVAAGGSVATGAAGPGSDLDLYVFTAGEPPLAARRAMVAALGDGGRVELDLRYWDPGDAWFSAAGVEVDVVYWDARWIGEQLERVLTRHEPSVGYSTCHWRTLRHMLPLFDRDGWLARLQARAQAPYPQALADAIIARNHPLLRDAIPCYRAQIAKALARGDDVSVNHRVAALLASYFDVLFALNRELHPGEKRLVAAAQAQCERLPAQLAGDVAAVLAASAAAASAAAASALAAAGLLGAIDALADGLDALLLAAGYDPRTGRRAP